MTQNDNTLILEETMVNLESLGNEKTKAQNTKQGAGDTQFGVKLGDIRKLAKKLKTNHELAMLLWDTNNVDARFLSILLLNPKTIQADVVDKMVHSMTFVRVADWLNSYVLNKHPEKEEFCSKYMQSDHSMALRSGWSITSDLVVKDPSSLDITALLDRIDKEMGTAPEEVQWTMNFTLANIGIQLPDHRNRALSIGEKLGIYRDYPTSKGCTSPFAPIWINEMVSRQK